MSNIEQKRVRAVSARPPALRPRSGKNRKMHQKTQFIENVYSNNQGFRKGKLTSMRYNLGESELEDVTKLLPKGDKIPKDRQELFEQNLLLKKQIHRLKDELVKTKSKIDTLATKNSKYTKQFNMQFEKKMYWTGHSSYLISGIKAQYDKLKTEHEYKVEQCEALKRQLIETQAPQFKVYAQTLQQENKKLVQRISKMSEISQQILFDNENEGGVPEYAYTQLQEKKERLTQKLKQVEYLLRVSGEEKKDQLKKIQFLQKLIIEKDNAQYHASKKSKKLEREKVFMDQEIQKLSIQIDQRTRNYDIKLQRFKSTEQQRYKSEKDIFERSLSEKDQKIVKLQKQVAYLSTLLTYWKPLDQINKEVSEKMLDNESNNEQLQINSESELKKSTKPRKGSEHKQNKQQFTMKNSTQMISSKEPLKSDIKKVRVQQTADKKHNESAQKKRRVEHHQVEHIGQHLKYRFLGLSLPLSEVKQYLNNVVQNKFILSENVTEEGVKWQDEYITMEQTQQVLMKYPFELGQENAHLLSRYLIEDSTNEHVYCDFKNQHKRTVIKSILKALVGEYDIFEEEKQKQIEKQCNFMLAKYQSNLLSALSTVASSGFVTRRKFLQLVGSLGIELSDDGKDYLICKMLLKSESLQKLQYKVIL